MKTKLLTICLLLFSSQVFAENILSITDPFILKIKCKNPNLGDTRIYKYIRTPANVRLQYKENLEWKDLLTTEVPFGDGGKSVWTYESREKGIVNKINVYDSKGNTIKKEMITYIDFEVPSMKFINPNKPEYSFEVECKFLR